MMTAMTPALPATDPFDLPDLASERLGGAVLAANDEFFAPKEGLIKPGVPEWREGVYTERGKWMDGWETRRRRGPGHDWAIVRLGVPGTVRAVVIDTSHYTGNYPERASLEWCAVEGTPSASQLQDDPTDWRPLLAESQLKGDAANQFRISEAVRVTHLRLNIFPDGGVARLRVHGEPVPDPRIFAAGREVDLAAMEHGGFVVACSDMHYGHRQNLILPGRSTHMGDGWETKRRRGPGHDWTIVRLARRGMVERVELDTDHYKGNAPGACMLEASDVPEGTPFDAARVSWEMLLDETPLEPHTRHGWASVAAARARPATHVRLNIFPDGGVARLRLIGRAVG
jgi:allantoicase